MSHLQIFSGFSAHTSVNTWQIFNGLLRRDSQDYFSPKCKLAWSCNHRFVVQNS